jgi:hypothetical protein
VSRRDENVGQAGYAPEAESETLVNVIFARIGWNRPPAKKGSNVEGVARGIAPSKRRKNRLANCVGLGIGTTSGYLASWLWTTLGHRDVSLGYSAMLRIGRTKAIVVSP